MNSPTKTQSKTVYEVSQLADLLRGLLESSLPTVWVQGEVSNFRNPAGHWYFTLKDANAQLRCAMFKGKNFHVRPTPKDGDAVLLRGQVSFYTQRGDLQLIVEHLEPAGTGALLRAFEQLKAKLAAEGLFDEHLKRPLPSAPRAIGLITSATAAALQDILNTLARRYPLAPVYLYPVPVQGDTAPPAILEALQKLPKLAPVEVLILARGGGSLEDLWCFNDERIARAIRACIVPVVTGIGHEIDFTIADFAADLRAPTPTAAAELVTPDIEEWKAGQQQSRQDLRLAMQTRLDELSENLRALRQRLHAQRPQRRLQDAAQRQDEWRERLESALRSRLVAKRQTALTQFQRLAARMPGPRIQEEQRRLRLMTLQLPQALGHALVFKREQLNRQHDLLGSLHPDRVLQRGYAIVRNAQGQILGDSALARSGEILEIRLAKGQLRAKLEPQT